MKKNFVICLLFILVVIFSSTNPVFSQNNLKMKFTNSAVCAGIEVGAKGVKISVLEIGKNAQSRGAFNILKDSSVNTDFISFNASSFSATLKALVGLYQSAMRDYKIPATSIYTVVSSGVKIQADKEMKAEWISNLVDSFRTLVEEPFRQVAIIDVMQEARLSHLGIVPESRRYNTFLIDIGSGNTKGGFFPYGNTKDFKLFQLSWGTKSTANTTDKQCGDDKALPNYEKQLTRVLSTAENTEIIYAVNQSGSYPVSDNIAFSGGIAWSVATLMFPELIDNSVITVSFDDVKKFNERIANDYASLSDVSILASIRNNSLDKDAIGREVKRVNQVFDQKSLMAGTGLLLKIMRQFSSVFESKQFYLVKNGQVGWISAYVDQSTENNQAVTSNK
jgi:hypothetical protein